MSSTTRAAGTDSPSVRDANRTTRVDEPATNGPDRNRDDGTTTTTTTPAPDGDGEPCDNGSATAIVDPRPLWTPRPDVFTRDGRFIAVRHGVKLDFEPVAREADGAWLYRLDTAELLPDRTQRPSELGC